MHIPALLAFILLALGNVALSGPTTQTNIETRTLDEIYKAALQESGTLRVAWGGDIKASQTGIIKAFESRFPKIKLNLTVDLSKYWDSRIDRAYQISRGKDNGVDVAILQTLHDFYRWKDEGRLLPYKVASWNDIYPEFIDHDGAYTGLYIFGFGHITFNPSQMDASQLPDTYRDFLSQKYSSGQLSLTYPNDDDAVLYLFSLITQKYGWEFINALSKQNVQWVRGTATPAELISKASSRHNQGPTISFASESGFTPGLQDKLMDDVYMTWPQTGAIFANTKHPETAKLFLSFLMHDDWQHVVGTSGFATRRSLDKRRVFDQSPNMDALGYLKFVVNRRLVEWWRFQFEDILGLPQGINPNDIDF